ncbi:MAG: enoyl-CoA hydratase [Verrucomicrobiales bacterium]|jgi:enoyl-CoA hydratase
MSSSIQLEPAAAGVEVIKIDRPAARNALTLEMLEAFVQALDEVRSPALVITGLGGSFCTGADLDEIAGPNVEAVADRGQEVVSRIRDFPGLTIAAVNGLALGGGMELALACDVRWATKKSVFALPECGLGVLPAWGGIELVQEKLPSSVALEILLLGKKMTASRAFDLGFVSRILDGREFESAWRKEIDLLDKSLGYLTKDLIERVKNRLPADEARRRDKELLVELSAANLKNRE